MSGIKPKNSVQKKSTIVESRLKVVKNQLVYYREITETIREPFIILTRDLHVVTANLAFYRMFKVRKKDTEGRHIYELGDNQWDILELRELLERLLPQRRVLSNFEITLSFPLLGRKTMLLNARQVDSKQLILLAFEDITAEKTFERDTKILTENLTKQRDQLQWLNDTKDEFISLASHQLRTPATVVKQYVEMLNQGYAGQMSEDQTAMLNVAYANNERQLEIIEDLLRVAKVDAGKVYLERTLYDASLQVETIVRELKAPFSIRNQSILFEKPNRQMIVFNDAKLMRMALENILDNAGKYSQDGGKVIIHIEQDKNFTNISFKDDGVGISQKNLPKLFKKFVRIDNPLSASVKGTGLGLYWTKKVIDLHGGEIEVKSRLHSGTTFTVKTPVSVSGSPKNLVATV